MGKSQREVKKKKLCSVIGIRLIYLSKHMAPNSMSQLNFAINLYSTEEATGQRKKKHSIEFYHHKFPSRCRHNRHMKTFDTQEKMDWKTLDSSDSTQWELVLKSAIDKSATKKWLSCQQHEIENIIELWRNSISRTFVVLILVIFLCI